MIDTARPAGVELGPAWVDGRPSMRLMVILRAPGCRFAIQTGGCTFCGFQHLTTRGAPVSEEDLVAQLRAAFEQVGDELDSVGHLDLYNSGSFFCDDEIPPQARSALLSTAATLPSLKVALVESRPEFVSADKLARAREALGAVKLELAIGLESVDDRIRLELIRKGFTMESFDSAAGLLADAGVDMAVYVLLKPLGVEEDEAVDDVLATGRYLRSLGDRISLPIRVALEPAFVPEETPLFDAMQEGRYHPPSLWSAVKATLGLARLGLPVHVGLSSEGLPAETISRGCALCTDELRAALARYNETQDRCELTNLDCTCQH